MKNNIEKTVAVLMWVAVALTILIFFASIMFGHAKGYEFIFGFADTTNITTTVFQAVKSIG